MFSRAPTICASCRQKLLRSTAAAAQRPHSLPGAVAAELRATQRGYSRAATPAAFAASRASLHTSRAPTARRTPVWEAGAPRHRREFTSTPRSRAAAAATLNPRTDDEGNAMEVEITPRAANRLREIMLKDANPKLCLRVQVESGGCHGFQYLMSLTDLDKVSREEDTVFEADGGGEAGGGGTAGGGGGGAARVVMDEPSLELLKGSKVDYTMELIGSQFKIVDNPLATSSCGCGTSFDIKA